MMDQGQQMPQIMINEPGKPPRPLTGPEIVQLIQQQQQQIQEMATRIQQMEQYIAQANMQIAKNAMQIPGPSIPTMMMPTPSIHPSVKFRDSVDVQA